MAYDAARDTAKRLGVTPFDVRVLEYACLLDRVHGRDLFVVLGRGRRDEDEAQRRIAAALRCLEIRGIVEMTRVGVGMLEWEVRVTPRGREVAHESSVASAIGS